MNAPNPHAAPTPGWTSAPAGPELPDSAGSGWIPRLPAETPPVVSGPAVLAGSGWIPELPLQPALVTDAPSGWMGNEPASSRPAVPGPVSGYRWGERFVAWVTVVMLLVAAGLCAALVWRLLHPAPSPACPVLTTPAASLAPPMVGRLA
ncbi:hypothetical protein I6A60_24815 [Frankia sp. AgB1.9]|uniref:hypothetical protein n=1 Tax=unclassified Frankia TaxID=2632575 RepID=UPI001932862B|nr:MULTISPECIES: hypothetical protein [unclassified Frankia]MBL7487419.1 hypothetical protein [Frankia sp. AgW1.1]MBL7551063.1 hypothetical protein [Frankia sp. AgB1.9]MBL7618844.1 hypothetical protein [Frankia sp. AgB1.8]